MDHLPQYHVVLTSDGPGEYVLLTPVSLSATQAALLRAAHILRHEGHGGYDIQQADIIEALLIKEKM